MRRPLVIAALLYSAAIHAALTPEHVKEMPLLGISFAVAAAAATATAGWLVIAPQSSHAFLAAAALCTGMTAAWVVAVTVGIPFLMDAAEPVDATAVICKLVEAVGNGELVRGLSEALFCSA